MNMIVRDQADTFAIMAPAAELAGKIAQTEFVPASLRNKPAAVLACILAGREIGLPPMQSLSQIAVIEGRPSLMAQGARTLILSRGHELWVEESTITRCVMHARRRGEEHLHTATWTIDDAKRAGLAAKQNWTRYPRQMLWNRCTGDLARIAFADVLGGMPYLAEELQDGGFEDQDQPPVENGEQSKPRARARRAPRRPVNGAAAAPPDTSEPPGPPLDLPTPEQPAPTPEPPSAGDAEPVDGNLTLAQRIAMSCREAGIERSDLIRAVTGKDRGRDLTREEAGEVLDAARAIARGEKRLIDVDGNYIVADVMDDGPDELPLTDADR